MRYEGTVIRPPSEANSLIIQLTLGCAHNKCTFCGTFKDKPFRMRKISDVLEDLELAHAYYGNYLVKKFFLADGDALVCKNSYLIQVADKINELFPECERIGIYGRALDVLRKTDEELLELKKHKIGIVYMGVESGNDEILTKIKKGETREDMIVAVKKLNRVGIESSLTFIIGIGGKKLWKQNAIDTGTLITLAEPTYASFLTLMLEENTELYDDYKNGKFTLLSPKEMLEELELMLTNTNVKKPCIFRSNHASNYVSLKGTLPQDKKKLIEELIYAENHSETWKDEFFRGL